jgi:hypothetical protein
MNYLTRISGQNKIIDFPEDMFANTLLSQIESGTHIVKDHLID